jgi:acyl carrier protein
MTADVGAGIRSILEEVLGTEGVAQLPDETRLFGADVALGSLTGARVLRLVRERFGVDVASEDLNLDALETIGTLSAFVAARLARAD